jgi:hypothetical protein
LLGATYSSVAHKYVGAPSISFDFVLIVEIYMDMNLPYLETFPVIVLFLFDPLSDLKASFLF